MRLTAVRLELLELVDNKTSRTKFAVFVACKDGRRCFMQIRRVLMRLGPWLPGSDSIDLTQTILPFPAPRLANSQLSIPLALRWATLGGMPGWRASD